MHQTERADVETQLSLLDSSRRRLVIRALEPRDQIAVNELIDVVAEHENGPDYDDDRWKTVQVSLLQTHLPRLDENGVVEWDRADRFVERDRHFDQLHKTLRCARGEKESLRDSLRSLIG